MCQRAIELGLRFICFTEHLDLDPRDDGYRYFHPEVYFAEIEKARSLFHRQLVIGAGVEACYQSQRQDEIASWLERWPFDFVLGSVHIVDHGGEWVMVPDRASMLAWSTSRTMRAAYLPYFEELRRAAASGLFDALAHLDLVKRYGTLVYGPFDHTAFADELDAVLETAIAHGTAIEINTSGLFQPARETFPGLDTVRRYYELGGRILTIGSDSHDVYQLGRGLEVAIAQAQAAGFSEIACFLRRRPQFHSLPATMAQEPLT